VRKEGFEPPRPFGHKILSLARLPVPPLPQWFPYSTSLPAAAPPRFCAQPMRKGSPACLLVLLAHTIFAPSNSALSSNLAFDSSSVGHDIADSGQQPEHRPPLFRFCPCRGAAPLRPSCLCRRRASARLALRFSHPPASAPAVNTASLRNSGSTSASLSSTGSFRCRSTSASIS
jgi:hypothetical protein